MEVKFVSARSEGKRAGQELDPEAKKPKYFWMWKTGMCFKENVVEPVWRGRLRV